MKRTGLRLIGVGMTLALTVTWLLASASAAPPGQQPVAKITSPRDNSKVRGQVLIMGTATHPEFWKYEVAYGPEPNPTDQWPLIGAVHESQVAEGVLERWDTNLLPDGVYSLRLRVARRDGNYDEFFVRGVVVANKVPTETPTPAVTPTPTQTPTPLPPTPTVLIEQPTIAPTPTPRPIPVTPTPPPRATVALPFESLRLSSLGTACFYGAGAVGGIFLLFGFLSLLRWLVLLLLGRG
jgi:hypothetical protein